MRTEKTNAFYADIYIAGDMQVAKQICREFCAKGACVRLSETTYIYTGGEEIGIKAGLINYPRFPKENDKIVELAEELAMKLLQGLYQGSCLIQTPDTAYWYSLRQEDQL